MSGVAQAREQIDQAWRRLVDRWQATCVGWNDVVRQHFEQEFWVEHERTVPGALRVLGELAETLAEARRSVH